MAQITDTLIAEYERAHADGKHAPMTIGEEQQLIHAWKQQHQPQQSPARVEGELTDEQIREIVRVAVSEDRLSWLGYDLDENERYTIPSLSPCHYQLARAIERALNQRLAVKEGTFGGTMTGQQCPACAQGKLIPSYVCSKCETELCSDSEVTQALSTHPVSDDQQAKDAARYRIMRATTTAIRRGDEVIQVTPEDVDRAADAAIDAALSATKQEG